MTVPASRRIGLGLDSLTRRDLLRNTAAASVIIGAGGSLASGCGSGHASPTATGPQRRGGHLKVAVGGGSSADTLDAHFPNTGADYARVWSLYEPLIRKAPDFSELLVLAESIEPNKSGDQWTVRLRKGVKWHDGKPLRAEDLMFTIRRILDPKNPGISAANISYVDPNKMSKLDDRTVRFTFDRRIGTFRSDVAEPLFIVPVGYNPKRPVSTSAFRYRSFTPGRDSVFDRFADYWGHPAYVDQLSIIDIADDTARVNALQAGQVHAIADVPYSQVALVEGARGLHSLRSKSGNHRPLTMRSDRGPFADNRVRRAFKLIADRPALVEQAAAGYGTVASDTWGRYDPCYEERVVSQDLEQAKSLLKQAGQENLTVELIACELQGGMVEMSQVFAAQAKAAGVTVNVRNVEPGPFYSQYYQKAAFSVDFWPGDDFLVEAALGFLKNSAYNAAHFSDPTFTRLFNEAQRTLDDAKRCALKGELMRISRDDGPWIVWGWVDQLDAYSDDVTGFVPNKFGFPLTDYDFKRVSFT